MKRFLTALATALFITVVAPAGAQAAARPTFSPIVMYQDLGTVTPSKTLTWYNEGWCDWEGYSYRWIPDTRAQDPSHSGWSQFQMLQQNRCDSVYLKDRYTGNAMYGICLPKGQLNGIKAPLNDKVNYVRVFNHWAC